MVTYAERRSEADLNARNLRLCSDRIEFEALTNEAICRGAAADSRRLWFV